MINNEKYELSKIESDSEIVLLGNAKIRSIKTSLESVLMNNLEENVEHVTYEVLFNDELYQKLISQKANIEQTRTKVAEILNSFESLEWLDE